MKQYQVEIVNSGRRVYVVLPFDARAAFGKPKGTLYVDAVLNNVPMRGKLTPLKDGSQALMLNKDLQKQLGYAGEAMAVAACFDEYAPDTTLTEPPPTRTGAGMDVLEAITTRASIRRYTGEDISQKDLDTLLNAGFCAPSASNKRPWHFVVVRSRDTLRALADAGPYTKMLPTAPLAIVVCADNLLQGLPELYLEDCAAAIQNMLLAAHGLGLGAVWCGMLTGHPLRSVAAEKLALPANIAPMAVVAVGHPAETRTRPARFAPGRVHTERW